MAMEFRTLHKMETDPVMKMMEKSLRITTEYCLGYIFISNQHIVEFPFTLFLLTSECSLVSGIQSDLAVNGY